MTTAVRTTQRAYPAYKDSGIEWLGEIPEHWEVWKVTHGFGSIGSGTTPKSDNDLYYEGTIPWITTSELREAEIFETSQKVTEQALRDYFALKLYAKGSLAIAMYGATIGRLGILGINATVNQACCVFSEPSVFDTKFFYYWLWMRRPILVSLSTGGGQPNLSQDDLKQLRVPLPPLPEQEAIARFLDHKTAQIDALIAKKEALLARLADKRTALISQAVTQGLDPTVPMRDSGIEWLGEIPEHWEVVKFRYCCSITQGQIDPTLPDYSERILIAPNHIESGTGRILFTETASDQGASSGKYLVNPGDIIYSKIRPALNKVCIADGYWLCSADMYPIRVDKGIDRSFMIYFLLSEQFVKLMVDESMRVAMPKVNRETLAACPIICPPQNEQREIALYLDLHTKQIDQQSSQIQSAIDKLKQYRTALITNAVTGKIDVREAGSWATQAPTSS